ncbi:MAG: hypothetical protein U9R03_01695, partial [Candidatus Aerophobetes bacterium]|nr:hypothetical protein [Candidatus Aerophobetes bacterium]
GANGKLVDVEVDFLAGEYGGTGKMHRTQKAQDIRARKTRGCEKDAYDIYFTVLHYPGGPLELAKVFEPFTSNRLVKEGLKKIRSKFLHVNEPGPVWIVNFLEIDDKNEKERIKRDAFERVNAFLNALNIEPFEEGKSARSS